MIDSIIKALGFVKPVRKKEPLPAGLEHLTVVPAKRWWN